MDKFKADFSQVDLLDIQGLGKSLVTKPPRKPVTGLEKSALKSTLEFGQMLDSKVGLLLEPVKVSESKPKMTVTFPKTIPVGLTGTAGSPPSTFDLTLAVGVSASAFAVLGATGAAGIYGATTPELGVFASVGAGWWTNVGAAVGPSLTFIFGGPSDLAGVSWGIGCDARFMTGSVGGLLLFTPPPFRFLGFSVGLSVGPSAIPAFDVTLQVSNTWTKPLLK
jgi:hypothetical protein